MTAGYGRVQGFVDGLPVVYVDGKNVVVMYRSTGGGPPEPYRRNGRSLRTGDHVLLALTEEVVGDDDSGMSLFNGCRVGSVSEEIHRSKAHGYANIGNRDRPRRVPVIFGSDGELPVVLQKSGDWPPFGAEVEYVVKGRGRSDALGEYLIGRPAHRDVSEQGQRLPPGETHSGKVSGFCRCGPPGKPESRPIILNGRRVALNAGADGIRCGDRVSYRATGVTTPTFIGEFEDAAVVP